MGIRNTDSLVFGGPLWVYTRDQLLACFRDVAFRNDFPAHFDTVLLDYSAAFTTVAFGTYSRGCARRLSDEGEYAAAAKRDQGHGKKSLRAELRDAVVDVDVVSEDAQESAMDFD